MCRTSKHLIVDLGRGNEVFRTCLKQSPIRTAGLGVIFWGRSSGVDLVPVPPDRWRQALGLPQAERNQELFSSRWVSVGICGATSTAPFVSDDSRT